MQDNALLALEIMHRFVETLDRYFGNVLAAYIFAG